MLHPWCSATASEQSTLNQWRELQAFKSLFRDIEAVRPSQRSRRLGLVDIFVTLSHFGPGNPHKRRLYMPGDPQ
jgi:hypothetical protein